MYSQNEEEKHILEFFGETKGNLLSIGENDGKTFSNALALIEKGWKAALVEPSPTAYKKLFNLHSDNLDRIALFNIAISTQDGEFILHESKHHLPTKDDVALLSSLDNNETQKWRNSGVEFSETKVQCLTLNSFYKFFEPIPDFKFDFITIDAEGMDIDILKQIDLTHASLICVEWNENPTNKLLILEYCANFNMTKIIYESGENLLICRP